MENLPHPERLRRARRALDAKAKPRGALGRLEAVAARLAALQGILRPRLERARALVFAADHGVAAEGVSAYPPAVTAQMARTLARGGSAANVLARSAGADVEVVDVGVDANLNDVTATGTRTSLARAKVRQGTRNLLHAPAITAPEMQDALEAGRVAARRACADGIQALALGDLGIGNTTAAAALLAALTGHPAGAVVGRGTGVDDAGLARKRQVVEAALARHAAAAESNALPSSPPEAARHALASLGGLEIAALVGAMQQAAHAGVAVIVGGFPVTVAALAALRMAPSASATLGRALFFAHRGAEAGHARALDACAAEGAEAAPLLEGLEMRLGEASGALAALPLLRSACALFDMATFAEAGVAEPAGEYDASEYDAGESASAATRTSTQAAFS